MGLTNVTYGLQYTRNLGNFENARVYYEITDTVRDGESVDDAQARITNKVDSWVQARVEEIDREAAGR